jgi:uncharacterized membrane protein YvlD (DUF360 family)
MYLIIEFIIVFIAFWVVSNRMEGVTAKDQKTVLIAAAVYMFSYAVLKTLIMLLFKVMTLGLFGFGFLAILIAAPLAMYIVTKLVDGYTIDSFPVLAAAVFVISVVSSILRFLIYFI